MGGKSSTVSNSAPIISSLRLQTSALGRSIAVLFGKCRVAGNLLGYWDFTAHAHTETTESGGKGGGGVTQSNTTYTYTAAVLMAIGMGEIQSVSRVWRGKSQFTLAKLGLSLFDGDYTQIPLGYLTTKHNDQALNYRGIAYVGSGAYSLGDTAQLDNHTFEVLALAPFGGGIEDANPADVVETVLTDPDFGAHFPSARLGDLQLMADYCAANGIFISPAYTDAQAANQVLEKLAKLANCGIVNSEGKLKLVPYGDEAATGNGATYTPNLTAQFDLTDDHFLRSDGEDPVKVERGDPADAYNYVVIKVYNRDKDYAEEPVDAQDDAHIEKYGLRARPSEDYFEICDVDVARVVVQHILQRELYVRNTYRFRLDWSFAELEPMDVVTLTESAEGLQAVPVLITSIEEDEDGMLSIEAEDFPAGVSSTVANAVQGGLGYNADYNADPGDVNAPLLFDGPGILTVTGFEVWAALSGGEQWGGCEVWISEDDATYKFAGTIFGRARHGVLGAPLGSAADPDTTSTLEADLTISRGELAPASQDDVDKFNTLMLVGRELVAYRDSTLTAPNEYDLEYLRRGVYNSPISSHLAGEAIARLDQAIFRHAYDPAKAGSTVYLKFLSFNLYGFGLQELSDVSAYQYTIQGSTSYPSNVTGFSATQNDIVVLFQWNFVDEVNVEGYEIRRNPLGNTNWDDGEPVTQVTRGTQITTAKVPPGDWTFLIAARDTSRNYSRIPARKDLTVVNAAEIVVQVEQSPTWPGTRSGFVLHWTGKLLFESTKDADQMTNAELFEQFVPYPVASASYEAPEIDAGVDGSLRVWGSITAVNRSDKPGTAVPELEIDYHLAAGAYDGFQPWTIGTIEARYVKERFTISSALGTPIVTGFLPTMDAEEHSESQSGLVISAGGTTINFLTDFFSAPLVSFENDDTVPLTPVITALSNTSFTARLYNPAGTSVGGVGKYRATGV